MKSNLDKLFKTDSTLEAEGAILVIQEADEARGTKEISFRVRRVSSNNPKLKAALTKHYKPHARQIEMGTMSQEKETEINIKMFVEACLVSWTGVEDENGAEIEMTAENAKSLFKSLPDLFDSLWKYANDFSSYKEDVGNF